MGVLNDQIQSDWFAFLDPDTGMGETWTYIPAGGGAPKTVNVYVVRPPARRLDGLGQVADRVVELWLANDPTAGSATITIGGDTFAGPARWGDATNTVFTVNEIVDQDAGCWHLRLV